MKVFWSWQSDTDGKTGRFFVRDCIAAAIKRLKKGDDVEEPTEREAIDALHLDQDRKGLPGSPDLARAILDKIDRATVVVADVTIVCKSKGTRRNGKLVKGRSFINPNVGIELGYALKALGDASTLLVMNAHYGSSDELPFDLRHKGVSLVYDLAPEADKAAIQAEHNKLVGTLIPALKHYAARAAAPKTEPVFQRWPAKRAPAFFFERDETLATAGIPGRDEIAFGLTAERAISLRLIPSGQRKRPFSPRELRECVDSRLGPFWIRGLTGLAALNEYGAIVHEPWNHNQPFNEMKALTQVFPTGEIWGIHAWLLRDRPQYERRTILPALPFEKTCYDTLHRYVRFVCDQLSMQPPFEFEGAMTGAKNVYLAFEDQQEWGPIHQDVITHRAVLPAADSASVSSLLLSFFEAVYDQTSYARPKDLFGFPPDPPNEAAWRRSGIGLS